jgi:hypothetical protein
MTAPMTSTRTEYAVRYTGTQYGRTRVLVDEPTDPTDHQAALRLLDHTLAWQAAADKRLKQPVDAQLVTRTVRTSDWVTEEEASTAANAADVAEATKFQDALQALAMFAVLGEGKQTDTSRTALSLLTYVLVDSRRPAAAKYDEPIADDLYAWADDVRRDLLERARASVAAREARRS